jgi:acetyltransferase-like isoleucine patch superfamily enzyme
MIIFKFLYKLIRFTVSYYQKFMSKLFSKFHFYGNGVIFSTFNTNGYPFVRVSREGKMKISSEFKMNNTLTSNPIGRPQKCVVVVEKGGSLEIGKNVGISSTAIVVHSNVVIMDNVKIGGGTCIYDTDFHSLNAEHRLNSIKDKHNTISKPILIKESVFIGANCTILKGVTIGENSVVGACSLVSKNIPDNEIWAGNPATFIKKNQFND